MLPLRFGETTPASQLHFESFFLYRWDEEVPLSGARTEFNTLWKLFVRGN